MTELFNYVLINLLVSFILKIYTCKVTTKVSLFSFDKCQGKVLLGICLAYKSIKEQNQYPYTCIAN